MQKKTTTKNVEPEYYEEYDEEASEDEQLDDERWEEGSPSEEWYNFYSKM